MVDRTRELINQIRLKDEEKGFQPLIKILTENKYSHIATLLKEDLKGNNVDKYREGKPQIMTVAGIAE